MKIKSKLKIKSLGFLILSLSIFLILKKLNLLNFEILIQLIKKQPGLIIFSSLIYAISILLGSLRYKIILNSFRYKLKLKDSLRITGSSIFYGQWFPGSSALIEFFRIFFLKKYVNIKLKEAIITAFYDKIIGLISFIIICFFFILIKYNFYEKLIFHFFIIVLILFLINKIIVKIIKFYKTNYKTQNYFFISAELIISLLISTLIILSYFLISKVTGAQLSLIDIGIMMPLIAIIGILPVGLGNLGGLQVGTLLVFQFISEKSTEIILMSLIFILITILVNSIFGIIFLKSSFSIFKQTLLNYEKKL